MERPRMDTISFHLNLRFNTTFQNLQNEPPSKFSICVYLFSYVSELGQSQNDIYFVYIDKSIFMNYKSFTTCF